MTPNAHRTVSSRPAVESDPHSTWSVQAGLARASTLVADLGRFSDAETLLENLMRDPGAARDEVRHNLTEGHRCRKMKSIQRADRFG